MAVPYNDWSQSERNRGKREHLAILVIEGGVLNGMERIAKTDSLGEGY